MSAPLSSTSDECDSQQPHGHMSLRKTARTGTQNGSCRCSRRSSGRTPTQFQASPDCETAAARSFFGFIREMRRINRICVRSLPAHISIYQCAIIEMAHLAAGCWSGIMHDDRRHLAPEPRGCLMWVKYTSCGCAGRRLRAVFKSHRGAPTVFCGHTGTSSCSVGHKFW